MRIAIVQDELIRRAGGERVGLCFHYAFPNAPVYTIAYRENDTFPEYKECTVRTSWFDKIIKNEHGLRKLFFPFGIIAMKMLDLTEFDIVLQSGTHCSKYVKVHKNSLVITYCYTPFRLAWNPSSYSEYTNSKGFKRVLFDLTIKALKFIDKQAAQRSDLFVSMTVETALRVKKAYDIKGDLPIINPPVSTQNFYLSEDIGDFYFLLSRLEFYKKVDLVVQVFNKLGKRLIIVGRGSKEEELKAMANSNITFLKNLSDSEMAKLYSNCKAFLMPQHEDYGITPLEANASGRPVICFDKGGVKETMIPYETDALKCTAVFFHEQSEKCLIDAIEKFEKLTFNPAFIRSHSEKFDEKIFIDKIKNLVLEKFRKSK